MPKIILRWYQQKVIDGIYEYWHKGLRRLVVFAATRSGKTIIFTWIALKTISKGNNVLILTNRQKLFDQTSSELVKFGLEPYFITAKTKAPNYNFKCFVAMSQTLQNRLKEPIWQEWFIKTNPLIVIDEAHLCDVTAILQNPICKDSYVLGFTGSPKRSGNQREFSEDGFSQIVIGPYTADLEPKYCVPAKVYEVPMDMSDVSKKADGEYNNYETFKKFDTPKKYQGAVHNWQKFAPDTVTIGYCVSIIHAAKTCVEFVENGIPAKFISSKKAKPKTPTSDNKATWTKYRIAMEEWEYLEEYKHLTGDVTGTIKEWERGEFLVLMNVDILTFGYNNNAIKCVLVNFASMSIPKWLQAVNRGGTPMEGKDHFIVLDLGGNSERLGDYNHRHEWDLRHRKPDGGGVPGSRECPDCGALVLASARICDWCGFQFPKSEEEQFIELVERQYVAQKPKELSLSDMSFKEIEEYAKQRQKLKGKTSYMSYAWNLIYAAHEEEGLKEYAKTKGYHWTWCKRIIDKSKKKQKVKL